MSIPRSHPSLALLVSLLGSLLLAAVGHAQTWSKILPSSTPLGPSASVREMPGGDVVVAALLLYNRTTWSRLDAGGGVIWQRELAAQVHGIDVRADGSLLACGGLGIVSPAWVGALDGTGALLWQWSPSADLATLDWARLFAVAHTADGGGVATGYRGLEDDDGEFYTELSLYRFDAVGNLLWDRSLGDATAGSSTWGTDALELADGTLAVVGRHQFGLLVMRLDANGGVLWKTRIARACWMPRVSATPAGDLVVVTGNSGDDNLYLAKLDPGGTPIWQREYPGVHGDNGKAVQAMPDGGAVVVGRTASYGTGFVNLPALRVDAAGAIQWQRVHGNADSEIAFDLALTASGDLLVAGLHQVPGQSSALVLRLDAAGLLGTCPVPPTFADEVQVGYGQNPTGPLVPIGDSPVAAGATVIPASAPPVDVCQSSSIGTRYCDPARPNSTGAPAELWVTGSTALADDDADLVASSLPQHQFGYFLAGMSAGTTVPPGSQGALCLIGGPIFRYSASVLSSGSGGAFGLEIDLQNVPGHGAIQAGETWNFQAWFRDLNPGPTSNFTDAVSVTFG